MTRHQHILGLDPGFGGFKLAEVTPAGLRTACLPAVVGVGDTDIGLRMPNRGVVLRALELYESQPVDFEVALAAAHIEQQGIHEIISYDRDFD